MHKRLTKNIRCAPKIVLFLVNIFVCVDGNGNGKWGLKDETKMSLFPIIKFKTRVKKSCYLKNKPPS